MLPSTSAKVEYYFLALQCTSGTREVWVIDMFSYLRAKGVRRNMGGKFDSTDTPEKYRSTQQKERSSMLVNSVLSLF